MQRQHEALAAVVDQRRAFAAQRFGRERRRIAADHDRGRMELHEFRIGDHRAGARGDREPKPAGLGRIGGHGIEMPDAAGRQHDRARRDDHRSRGGVAGLAQLQAGDRAVLGQQRFGDVAFDHADRRRLAHRVDQRRDDRRAGHVAAHMHDAPRRMRGLAADRELAFEVAVERHAVARAGRGCARRLRAPIPARPPRRPGRRRPRSCRRHAPRRCRLRRPPRRCRPAPRRSRRPRRAVPRRSR